MAARVAQLAEARIARAKKRNANADPSSAEERLGRGAAAKRM
jgi:hypothetical protein